MQLNTRLRTLEPELGLKNTDGQTVMHLLQPGWMEIHTLHHLYLYLHVSSSSRQHQLIYTPRQLDQTYQNVVHHLLRETREREIEARINFSNPMKSISIQFEQTHIPEGLPELARLATECLREADRQAVKHQGKPLRDELQAMLQLTPMPIPATFEGGIHELTLEQHQEAMIYSLTCAHDAPYQAIHLSGRVRWHEHGSGWTAEQAMPVLESFSPLMQELDQSQLEKLFQSPLLPTPLVIALAVQHNLKLRLERKLEKRDQLISTFLGGDNSARTPEILSNIIKAAEQASMHDLREMILQEIESRAQPTRGENADERIIAITHRACQEMREQQTLQLRIDEQDGQMVYLGGINISSENEAEHRVATALIQSLPIAAYQRLNASCLSFSDTLDMPPTLENVSNSRIRELAASINGSLLALPTELRCLRLTEPLYRSGRALRHQLLPNHPRDSKIMDRLKDARYPERYRACLTLLPPEHAAQVASRYQGSAARFPGRNEGSTHKAGELNWGELLLHARPGKHLGDDALLARDAFELHRSYKDVARSGQLPRSLLRTSIFGENLALLRGLREADGNLQRVHDELIRIGREVPTTELSSEGRKIQRRLARKSEQQQKKEQKRLDNLARRTTSLQLPPTTSPSRKSWEEGDAAPRPTGRLTVRRLIASELMETQQALDNCAAGYGWAARSENHMLLLCGPEEAVNQIQAHPQLHLALLSRHNGQWQISQCSAIRNSHMSWTGDLARGLEEIAEQLD